MRQLNLDMASDDATGIGGEGAGFVRLGSPLAARMRPRSFDDYVGQKHIIAPGRLLRRAIEGDRFSSIILSGPPGVGKTSLAELVAKATGAEFIRLSGVLSTVADMRREIKTAAERRLANGRNTILFIDEIHRFNKAQQDVLLPHIEDGSIRFVGATTQNPNFYVVAPLLSRSLVFQLETLESGDIAVLLRRALDELERDGRKVGLTDEAAGFLADICEGDARRALNALELAVITTPPGKNGAVVIGLEEAQASIQKRAVVYGDDAHYDTASAFIKSMRGSDPDAAVYWLAKMLHAGEDIRFIARRIVIFASEDVGNADPRALSMAVDTMRAVEMIGMPEARIILSQAVTYCATAPKSNSAYQAINMALDDVRENRVQPVPAHLRDKNSSQGSFGENRAAYEYPHDGEAHFNLQEYLGVRKSYYRPGGFGYEEKIKRRMEYWSGLRNAGRHCGEVAK